MSHASNLPEGSAVDLVAPDHLLPLKRHLESFAFKIRKHSRDVTQLRVSTAVRFDEDQRSLVLACRDEGDTEWIEYTKEELEGLTPGLEPIDAEDEEEEDAEPSTPGAGMAE